MTLQNERIQMLQKGDSYSSSESPIKALKLKNLDLQRELARVNESLQMSRLEVDGKQAEIEELHIILNKLSEEMHNKNTVHEDLKVQYDLIQRANNNFIRKMEESDGGVRKTLKKHDESNTNNTNRNKSASIESSQHRKAGEIRIRSNHEENNSFQSISEIASISKEV